MMPSPSAGGHANVPSRIPAGPRSLHLPWLDPALSSHTPLCPLVGDPQSSGSVSPASRGLRSAPRGSLPAPTPIVPC